MTREEFNRKAEAGTLTVRDVLDNREFATAEQLAALTGEAVRIDAAALDKLTEATHRAVEVLDTVERLNTEAAAELWAEISEAAEQNKETTKETEQ